MMVSLACQISSAATGFGSLENVLSSIDTVPEFDRRPLRVADRDVRARPPNEQQLALTHRPVSVRPEPPGRRRVSLENDLRGSARSRNAAPRRGTPSCV